MKKLTLIILLFTLSHTVFCQSLPDTVKHGGYVFVKSWTNTMESQSPGWYLANWTFDANECEFTPAMGQFNNGTLDLVIDKKDPTDMGNHPEKPYWGAEYWSEPEFHYGRYVVSMQPNTPSGVVTSFFLSHIDWNTDYTQALEWYEIDIEFAGTNDEVQFTLHWVDNGVKDMSSVTVDVPYDITSEAHDWVIEWTPTYIAYYVDDILLHTFTDSYLLYQQDHPQKIQMNCWVSNAPSWVGVFDEASLPVVNSYEQIVYYELTNPLLALNALDNDELSIYPNPFEDTLLLSAKDWYDASYKITDHTGRTVKWGTFDQQTLTNLDSFKPGLYFIEITNENGQIKRFNIVKR